MASRKENSSNSINELILEERCVLNKVLKLASRRWLAEILFLIENDINRFSQLKDNLEGISDNVLSNNLNALVAEGLLTKKTYQQVPVKVEYQLSESCKELIALLHELCAWGKENVER